MRTEKELKPPRTAFNNLIWANSSDDRHINLNGLPTNSSSVSKRMLNVRAENRFGCGLSPGWVFLLAGLPTPLLTNSFNPQSKKL